MRQFKKIIIAASCLMCFAGCNAPNKDGLDEFRDKGQLIDLDYETLDSKLINKESFVFYLKQEGCSSCERFCFSRIVTINCASEIFSFFI